MMFKSIIFLSAFLCSLPSLSGDDIDAMVSQACKVETTATAIMIWLAAGKEQYKVTDCFKNSYPEAAEKYAMLNHAIDITTALHATYEALRAKEQETLYKKLAQHKKDTFLVWHSNMCKTLQRQKATVENIVKYIPQLPVPSAKKANKLFWKYESDEHKK